MSDPINPAKGRNLDTRPASAEDVTSTSELATARSPFGLLPLEGGNPALLGSELLGGDFVGGALPGNGAVNFPVDNHAASKGGLVGATGLAPTKDYCLHRGPETRIASDGHVVEGPHPETRCTLPSEHAEHAHEPGRFDDGAFVPGRVDAGADGMARLYPFVVLPRDVAARAAKALAVGADVDKLPPVTVEDFARGCSALAEEVRAELEAQPVHPGVARVFAFSFGVPEHTHERGAICSLCVMAFRDDAEMRRLARGGR